MFCLMYGLSKISVLGYYKFNDMHNLIYSIAPGGKKGKKGGKKKGQTLDLATFLAKDDGSGGAVAPLPVRRNWADEEEELGDCK